MKNNFAKLGLLFVCLIIFAGLLWFYFPGQNKLTRITVLGDSKAKLAPDTALLTFSVVTQNKQALNAQQENAKRSEAVKKAVESITKNAQIEFKTNNYNLEPEEDYSSTRMPKIIGYEVKNSVTVSVRDLNIIGEIIDAATKAGANSIDGISFVIGDDSPNQGSALASATKQAMAKAETIARSLNGKIVRVVETREGGISAPPASFDYYSANTDMRENNYKTPIQAGSVEMHSQVLLIVDIKVG